MSQGKVICTRCQTEIIEITVSCNCTNRDNDNCKKQHEPRSATRNSQLKLSTVSLLVLSSTSIILSAYFWYSVIVDLSAYTLHQGSTYANFELICAGWCFFIGWYCLFITVAQMLLQEKSIP